MVMKNKLSTSVVVNIIRTVTMTICSFITFPYVCSILHDTALGAYSWVAAFVYYFFILARISIPNIAVREVVKVKDDPEKLSVKVQELFIIQAIMTLLSFGLMTLLVFTLPAFKGGTDLYSYRSLAFILSLNFVTGVLSFEWVFTAFEKHVYLAIRSIIVYAVFDILIFLFVKYPSHVTLYTFFVVASTIVIVIVNLIYLPRLVKFKKNYRYNFKQYLPILGMLFLISFVVAVYDKTDTFILGLIDNTKKSVGSYSVGMKGVEIIIGIITSLSMVFIPRATSYLNNDEPEQYKNLNKYSVNLALFIVLPAIATMASLSLPITSLISGSDLSDTSNLQTLDYANANIVLAALASLMLTYSLSFIIYTQILIPKKKEMTYFVAMFVGCFMNIVFSLLFALVLMKNNPAVGVAIATSITDVVVLSLLIIATWKDVKEVIFNFNNLKIVLVSLFIAAISLVGSIFLTKGLSLIISSKTTVYLLDLLIIVSVDAVIYLGALFLLKEKLVRSVIQRIRHAI